MRDLGGFPAEKRPFQGVQNMKARARAIGGSLSIESAPGSGTIIRIWVPIYGRFCGGHRVDGCLRANARRR
jgi:signal transduction histidine kinase